MDVRTEILITGVLGLLALGVVVWRHVRARGLKEEQAGQLLTVAAIAAVLAWPNFGLLHGHTAVHQWEQFHYFLGSKYFPELRYDGLYSASLVAERELDTGRPLQGHARDLRTNEMVPTGQLLAHGREVRERFSADRWRAFVEDTRYFLVANSYPYITRIRSDHGYNPTPAWTFTARLFSRWFSASDLSLRAVAWLDPLVLFAASVMVFRTYGGRIGCLALIVLGLGYPWRFYWVGGAFLRHDWLAAVILAVCLMRRSRFAAAGGLIGYAAMVRVFPAGFLLGPLVVAVRDLIKRRSAAWFARLAAGCAVSIALCLAVGCLTGIGAAAWPQFLDNLEKHHGTWLTNNVGLTNVLLYDLATMRREEVNWSWHEPWLLWQEKMNRLSDERRPLLLAASALFLAIVAGASWQWSSAEAATLGTAVAFGIVVLTCYYWVMLLLIPLGRGRWLPTAGWLAINVSLFALHLLTPAFEMIYGLMSWALLLFFLAWLGPEAWRTASALVREARGCARHRSARAG